MKVEIWSDIACPFCYLGKRKFENALNRFENREEVEVIWHSFQLDPAVSFEADRTMIQYLVDYKGYDPEDVKEMTAGIVASSVREGLVMNFDKVKPANTLDAHRLLQLALQNGLQDEAEERLFKAYFTEGENIQDRSTLTRLGEEIGLQRDQLTKLLESDQYLDEVKLDFHEARQIGVRGVPFFLIDTKYTVSGAQDSNYFLKALTQAWSEKI
jgi:predicted DsbA family dithiol-disulfide isomerase